MKQETTYIPPLNEPPIGIPGTILYDNKQTAAQLFTMRGHGGKETYAVISPPNTRPFTKVSVIKQEHS